MLFFFSKCEHISHTNWQMWHFKPTEQEICELYTIQGNWCLTNICIVFGKEFVSFKSSSNLFFKIYKNVLASAFWRIVEAFAGILTATLKLFKLRAKIGIKAILFSKYAHALLEVWTCSTDSVHMLNWRSAYAQLEVCTCLLKYAHALLKVHMRSWRCAYALLGVCMHNWVYTCSTEVCTCSTGVCMLPVIVCKLRCMHDQP